MEESIFESGRGDEVDDDCGVISGPSQVER